MTHRLFLVMVWFVIIIPFSQTSLTAQEDRDYSLLGKYISNIPDYVIWPKETIFGDFVIGVLGPNSAVTYLRMYTADKAYKNQQILVKKYTTPEDAIMDPDLKMLFVSAESDVSLERVAKDLEGLPVLLITEGAANQRKPYMINLYVDKVAGIQLNINRNYALLHEVKISEKLEALVGEDPDQ